MAAGKQDFIIEQGGTWSRVLTWKIAGGNPVDLTGYTARMQLRLTPEDPTIILEFNTTAGPTMGTIVLGGVAGTITLNLTPAQTAGLKYDGPLEDVVEGADSANGKIAVYDLLLTSPTGFVLPLVRGRICLVIGVTR